MDTLVRSGGESEYNCVKKKKKTTMINMLKDDGWGVKESGKKVLKRHAVKAITCNA